MAVQVRLALIAAPAALIPPVHLMAGRLIGEIPGDMIISFSVGLTVAT
jgi:hypothetical protein